MKKIFSGLFLFTIILNLISCKDVKYVRDYSKGSIIEVRLKEALDSAKTDENIILFTQSTCMDCINLKKILIPYVENHNIFIKEVVLDKEGMSKEEISRNRKKINEIFPNFNSTPSMYYVKNGKIIDEIYNIDSEEVLDSWVVKNKLDKK